MEIVFDRVTKRYGRTVVIQDLNLKFNHGEFIALLGPSGCGKSTTLLMLAGIYKPSEGNILFDGNIMNDVSPRDRNIGMCFQSYALYPHKTVYQNIAFPLQIKKFDTHKIKNSVQEIARKLNIDELLDRKPGQLSGGQQQRVALARALVKQPDLLLLDEPLSNLDARLRINMRAEIKKLQQDLGINTVLVTHDQVEALTMADRIAVINDKKLQDFNTPDGLYDTPKNIFVANFVGNPPINLIDAELSYNSETYSVCNHDFRLNVPVRLNREFDFANAQSDIVIGIRPEDVDIAEQDSANNIKGQIYLVEPLGREKLVSIKIGHNKIRMIASPDIDLKIGQNIQLTFNLDKVHFFEKQSQESIRIQNKRN